jgi:hypothetical protein
MNTFQKQFEILVDFYFSLGASDGAELKCSSQNYWCFGLFPLSGILENRKHDVSETGSVSILG